MNLCGDSRRPTTTAATPRATLGRASTAGKSKALLTQWVIWALLGTATACRPGEDSAATTSSARLASSPAAPPAAAGVTEFQREAPPVAEEAIFSDVTAQTGVDFSFCSGRAAGEYAILESLGGGVAAFDYDLDGHVDLMFAGGGRLDAKTITPQPCGLFQNLGDLKFAVSTELAGATAAEHYTHGIFPADFDHDGFPDVAVSGYGGVQLLRNQGDGTFQRYAVWKTHAENAWSTSLAWGDFDADGHLDLYVPHYVDWSWGNHPPCRGSHGVAREVCAPREFSALSDAIYMSDGAGGFDRVTHEVGLVEGGKGLGAVAGDVDLDGDLDVYVANDTTDNFLYLNDGLGNFRESALLASVSGDEVGVNTGSMGVALEDVDNDGLPDLWVTNFDRELFALYRNEGSGLFSHVSRKTGLAALQGLYVGFGTVSIDYDFDGDRDMVVANGHVSYHPAHAPYRQAPLLLENDEGRRFRRVSAGGYFDDSRTGRGLAHADLNNDGGWDLVFSHLEEPAVVLSGPPGKDARWARVQLVGRESNRSAIGATLRIALAGGERLWMCNSGGSYLSQSDARQLLVIPQNEQVQDVKVHWPSGRKESFPFPPHGSDAVWVEGSSRPEM